MLSRTITILTLLALTASRLCAQDLSMHLLSCCDKDAAAFAEAAWKTTDLGKGACSMYAQIPMFDSMQSISVVKYPSSAFRTRILHIPGKESSVPSSAGSSLKAKAAMNAGYFHVKERIPAVYLRIGKDVLGHTHPTEVYRVNGIFGFRKKTGKQMEIAFSDTTSYADVSRRWHSAMASGPMLMLDGRIVVPEIMGDRADGANVAAMMAEQKAGSRTRTHYSSAQFYDRRHPRSVIGNDEEGNIYLVVIDGRFKGQGDGATIWETAYICSLLGMTDAINLDGGGSSAIWTDRDGVINHPRDNKKFDHDGERAVPNLIVAY